MKHYPDLPNVPHYKLCSWNDLGHIVSGSPAFLAWTVGQYHEPAHTRADFLAYQDQMEMQALKKSALPFWYQLCSPRVLHGYRTPEIAAFLDPIHGGYLKRQRFQLWSAEGALVVEDWGKMGFARQRLLAPVELPDYEPDDRVRIAWKAVDTLLRHCGEPRELPAPVYSYLMECRRADGVLRPDQDDLTQMNRSNLDGELAFVIGRFFWTIGDLSSRYGQLISPYPVYEAAAMTVQAVAVTWERKRKEMFDLRGLIHEALGKERA